MPGKENGVVSVMLFIITRLYFCQDCFRDGPIVARNTRKWVGDGKIERYYGWFRIFLDRSTS